MKKTIMMVVVSLATLLFAGAAISGVESLRGDKSLTSMSDKAGQHKQMVVEGGIERSYKIQPPMIPHKIDKETINLKVNTCLKCHSEKTYEKKKAPKVGDSHYVNRDGKTLETISSRRYFCSQCHAPQVGDQPLVENTFEGAK